MTDIKKFKIQTLGCKVNQYESEKIKETLISLGFEESKNEEECLVYIINTCTVTNLADKKSRQKIRQAISGSPNAKIIVTGCGVQNLNSKISTIDGITILSDKDFFKEFVIDLFNLKNTEQVILTGKNRAFLKIGDGCDRFCTYCIVPYVRGQVRSKPFDEVVQEAERLVKNGSKEIVLTSIHLGAYGKELKNDTNLALLLDVLAENLKEVRIRLSSLEPLDFSPEILEILKKHKNICRHIHLPLQHASNSILQNMNRRYTKENFKEISRKIKTELPDCELTTDIIVGFPGETEADFEELTEFVKEMDFLKCHVFKYSKRTGTPAAEFQNQIPEEIKHDRSKKLIEICNYIAETRYKSLLGKTVEILVEENQNNFWTGFTGNYIRIYLKSDENLQNKFVNVKVTEYTEEKLIGYLTAIRK